MKDLKYRVEWYNRPITSMLLISKMFGNEQGVYSQYKKVLKMKIRDVDLQDFLTSYLQPYVKGKLPEGTGIGVAHTVVGPVYRVFVHNKMMPLMEDGFETKFVRDAKQEIVIEGVKA